jgi:hypothetical protein
MPYDLSDFKPLSRNGRTKGPPEKWTECGTEELQRGLDTPAQPARATEGTNLLKKLPPKLFKDLSTVSDKTKENPSSVDFKRMCQLLEAGYSPVDAATTFLASKRGADAEKRKSGHLDDYMSRTLQRALAKVKGNMKKEKDSGGLEPDENGSDWRKGFKSRNQLNPRPPKDIIHQLVSDKSLTIIVAASYNCKTWAAMQIGKAISTGKEVWGFVNENKPMPFLYHVPEMDEARIRQRMVTLGIEDSEMFLVRAMEVGLWALDDPQMLASSRGAVVCLDTMGYFNETDDTSNYAQAIKFGNAVFRLLTEGKARAVIGLYHPPKSSENATVLTLQNMVLGSAGYGGILRSCLALRNTNEDLNDPNVRIYVQGLKNPGLKPFQLEGIPLRMSVEPGESPTLRGLTGKNNKKYEEKSAKEREVIRLLKAGVSVRQIVEGMKISHNTVKKIRDNHPEVHA